jgi:formate dehydrogenase iron-sulfur subunit
VSAAPTEIAVHAPEARRMGFFTDTTVCIGCKACEVACKQWNDLPAEPPPERAKGGYDYTGSLSGSTWRHVRFVEAFAPSADAQKDAMAALEGGAGGNAPAIPAAEGGSPRLPGVEALGQAGAGVAAEEMPDLVELADPPGPPPAADGGPAGGAEVIDIAALAGGTEPGVDVAGAVAAMDRWIFMSDVCKHCANAGCLDACPTGAIIRTEFETVVIQADVCNGCGYCVPACPFGVVDRDPLDGRAAKCTLCYDRLQDGLEPACAKACPTDSIQFAPYEELVEVAQQRVAALHARGVTGAYLYGAGDPAGEDPPAGTRQLAGGLGAFFLLTDPPERFGLPAQAESPIQENVVASTLASMGAGLLAAAGVAAAFLLERRRL